MFEPLPTPAEMAAWDQTAIRGFGLKAELLMENAGAAALDVLNELRGPLAGQRVLLVAGGGNNGGDAFVLARRLLDAGALPLVLHTKPRAGYKGEARYHMDLARKAGAELRRLDPARAEQTLDGLPAPDILVDGLLGTGFKGQLSAEALGLVQAMNMIGEECFVLALDIPSGLCGETGMPRPEAVRANATVAFHAAKLGCALPHAEPYVGRLEARRIGIPQAACAAAPARQERITEAVFGLLKPPAPDLHKGKAGHVLVIGGSEGLSGAAQLCGLAALRAGAGLVTVACPRGVLHDVKAGMPDLMALPLGPDASGRFGPEGLEELLPHLPRFEAVVIGPGLGRDPGAAEFLAAFARGFARHFSMDLARAWAPPCIFDADALFHLAQTPALMAELPANAVLTPHPGEMARLLGVGMAGLQADRPAAARRFSTEHKQVLVLKGAGTIVGQDGLLRLCAMSAPNLAVGGSGDVLAGVMAACLARGVEPGLAACLGVTWHALAGRLLSRQYPGRGNLASDIANALPQVLKELHPC